MNSERRTLPGGDTGFSMDAPSVTFGPGALREAGAHAHDMGMRRVALYTDAVVADLEHYAVLTGALDDAGIEFVPYTHVRCEPTDVSLLEAAEFASSVEVDGFISLGGGSVMDTAKAANLYSTYPADFLDYVNAPIGRGEAPPGPLRPHLACPTTCGTGSEATGIAVFDYLEMRAKTGIASRALRPTRALVDPTTTRTLSGPIVASTGFDVLSHAIESYTARPHTARPAPVSNAMRPMSQGANPWSDLGSVEAIRIAGEHLERAVSESGGMEARAEVMWAATLAGIAFGNAGCHAPHGMSYAVSGLVHDYHPAGYPPGPPMVPHGFSVIVNSPAVFRATAPESPNRHLTAAKLLVPHIDARPAEAGEALGDALVSLMRATGAPNGLTALGYDESDVPALVDGSYPQQRLLANAPIELPRERLAGLFVDAMRYW